MSLLLRTLIYAASAGAVTSIPAAQIVDGPIEPISTTFAVAIPGKTERVWPVLDRKSQLVASPLLVAKASFVASAAGSTAHAERATLEPAGLTGGARPQGALSKLALNAEAAPGPAAKEVPFEEPPFLGAPPSAALAAAAPSGCDLQASYVRNDSIVSVELDFVRAHFTINNPGTGKDDPVELRSYGGCKSGPAIFVRPGDTVRIDLKNKTAVQDPTCPSNGAPTRQGVAPAECFNTTNLHTHGLHVSPAGNSDNVLLNIAPQSEFPYQINIPADHPAGTFWYHAHRHGSTAAQVASGTAGALIVKGDRPSDIDAILHDTSNRDFPERLFLFQQIPYACFANDPGNPAGWWQNIYTRAGLYNLSNANSDTNYDPTKPPYSPWTCPEPSPAAPVSPGAVENFQLQLFSPTIWDTNGRFTAINGDVQPTIILPAGQIERWRFIHAGIHDTINVQLVRATPQVDRPNEVAASALTGNRLEQARTVQTLCKANKDTLVPQFEIAADGLTRTKIHTIHTMSAGKDLLESNYLQPGYRSDILVVFPQEGDYCLLDQAAPAQSRVHNGPGGAQGGGQGPSTPQLLAYIHVRGGTAVSGSLQEYVLKTLHDANPSLPKPALDGLLQGDISSWAPIRQLAPPSPLGGQVPQTANFQIGQAGFTINGSSYDPNVVNITRQVNTTDDWTLSSAGEPHIFHIHVNPFEVIDVMDQNGNSIFDSNGNCKATSTYGDLANQYCGMYHVFRDTVFVENNYTLYIRTKYDRYIGEYVLHCHILDHEDAGMMLNINIVPDITAPGGGLGMRSMHRASEGMPQNSGARAVPLGHAMPGMADH
jgi:FtsP/CotA-like multicopper oxidase with cupredoxin domain